MVLEHAQNYYETLDIRPDASQSEIRQAYLRTKSAYSKDSAALYSLFDEVETKQVLENIEQAYLVLSNPDKRKEYDRVHGLLVSNDLLPITGTQAATPAGNVFSFGAGAASKPQTSAPTPMSADAASSAAEPDAPAPSYRTSIANESEYATPRTLAGHEPTIGPSAPSESSLSSQSPTPPPMNSKAFSARENRLGIVRRIDLSKPYEKNTAMEEEIAKETLYRGDFFRKVREYRKVTIEELSEFTKISRTYLNCIESEEFEGLPAPAYLRGFVAQVAKALKLPHDSAANAYMINYKNSIMK